MPNSAAKGRTPLSVNVLRQAMGIPLRDLEYVYFVRGGDWVKIGRSTDVIARVRDLQTTSPLDLRIAVIVHGDNRLESRLHRRFASLHIRGEWFRCEPPLSSLIEEMIATDRSDDATSLLLNYLDETETRPPEKSPNTTKNAG